MTKEKLFNLVHELSLVKTIPNQVVIDGLNTFSKQERELFIVLVNHINGHHFKKNIKGGDL